MKNIFFALLLSAATAFGQYTTNPPVHRDVGSSIPATQFPVIVNSNGVVIYPTNFSGAYLQVSAVTNTAATNIIKSIASSVTNLTVSNLIVVGKSIISSNQLNSLGEGTHVVDNQDQTDNTRQRVWGDNSSIVNGTSSEVAGKWGFVGGGNSHIIGAVTGLDDDFIPIVTNIWQGSTVDWGTIGGGEGNTVTAVRGTVAGGFRNLVYGGAGSHYGGAIGGGGGNTVSNDCSVIPGGRNNEAYGDDSVVGGGVNNQVMVDAHYSTIAGGIHNRIEAGQTNSFISGGVSNYVNAIMSAAVGSYLTNTEYASVQIGVSNVPLTVVSNGNIRVSGAILGRTNALSAWPTAAATQGGFAIVNSNATVYILTSTPASLTWAATNKIAGP